ncbi:MAG TPA: hypothetical protein VFF06_10815 [Polyangia bacterium]|nr:hypothetical protein [Polyangia bacterium]
MNNAGKWTLIALVLAAPILHAQEDEDDPKGAPHRPATIAPVKRPAKTQEAAKPEPKAAETKAAEPKAAEPAVKRTTDVRPAKPIAAAGKPAAEKPVAEKPAPEAKPAPIAKPARQNASAPEAEAAPIARKPAARPSVEPAGKIATVGATVDGPNPARTVRVRLADGSQVVGLVHAEESDVLIIDCALGQLAIPRSRISTIAYDAAAGAGSKHAPVQALDDDDRLPPPRKRAAPAAATP